MAQQTGRALTVAATTVVMEGGDAAVRLVMAVEQGAQDVLEGIFRVTVAVEEGALGVVLEAQQCLVLMARAVAAGITVGVVWGAVWVLHRRCSSKWSGRFDAKTELRLSGREPEANVDRRPGARDAAAVLGRAFESRSLVEVEARTMDWLTRVDLQDVAAPGSWDSGLELYQGGHVELQWPACGNRATGVARSAGSRREYSVSFQPEEPRFRARAQPGEGLPWPAGPARPVQPPDPVRRASMGWPWPLR